MLCCTKSCSDYLLSRIDHKRRHQKFTSLIRMLSFGIFVYPVYHFLSETFLVSPKMFSSLDIERVLEVEKVGEKTGETPNDILESSGGGPAETVDRVKSEKRETNLPRLANIWVPEFGLACDSRWQNIVLCWHHHVELEPATLPESFLGEITTVKSWNTLGSSNFSLQLVGL